MFFTRAILKVHLCFEAGWKLWPFSHLITYGVIALEQRLLWVDCVELIWVTVLSMVRLRATAKIVSLQPGSCRFKLQKQPPASIAVGCIHLTIQMTVAIQGGS
ncbi:hypothetical protein Peur_028520 [Populus x canadensis]